MRCRIIREIVEAPGKYPVSKWLGKNMDGKERGRFHARLNRIEADEVVSDNWLAPYTSLSMWELRFDCGGKAYRVLCEAVGSHLIMLLATAKDEQITEAEEKRAIRRRGLIGKDETNVRDYPLPGRPSDDMERVR